MRFLAEIEALGQKEKGFLHRRHVAASGFRPANNAAPVHVVSDPLGAFHNEELRPV